MLLYYITDRTRFSGAEPARTSAMLERIAAAARWGVDYIQLREKDLNPRELEELTKKAVAAVRANSGTTRLLINSLVDVAIAGGADGVHLRASGDLPPNEARVVFAKCGNGHPVIGASCHTMKEVALAESFGADLAVFAPVFAKDEKPGTGVGLLREVCRREVAASSRMPVLALGGVTLENAAACMEAGAAGVAGIRLFQSGDLGKTVSALRKLGTSPATAASRRHPYQEQH